MSSMPTTCLSDLAIDRIAARGGARSTEAPSHLAGCPSCAVRLAAASAARESTATRPLPWETAPVSTAQVSTATQRPEPTAARRRAWVAPALALAASVALAVGVAVGGRGLQDDRGVDGVRTKGAIGRLSIPGAAPGRDDRDRVDGEALRPGDIVQWVVSLGAPRWVTIVGRDGAGTVGVYFPEGATAARVEAGESVALDRSLTLDAVPGDEALTVFFCERERPVGG